jgi:hypothetical protein
MHNNGNGIYSANLSQNLSYSKYIYPIQAICANSNQYTGADERVGIKVGESLFDYSAVVIGLLAICGILIFASFQLDKKFWDIKLFLFFSSFVFMIGAVFVGLQIVKTTTISSQLIIVFDIMFYVILAITMIVIYFFAKHKIVDALNMSKQK